MADGKMPGGQYVQDGDTYTLVTYTDFLADGPAILLILS